MEVSEKENIMVYENKTVSIVRHKSISNLSKRRTRQIGQTKQAVEP